MPSIEQIGDLFLLRFPPEQLTLVLSRTSLPDRVQRITAQQALENDPSISAVLDGPMYDDVGSTDAVLDYGYFDRVAHIEEPGMRPRSGITLLVNTDGSVRYDDQGSAIPDRLSDDTLVAVQLYPALLLDRENATNRTQNTSTDWRAGLAYMDDGQLALAVMRAPMWEFAEALRSAGAVHAGYTDGGGSTLLQTARGEHRGSSENRAVASWLGIRPSARSATPITTAEPGTHAMTTSTTVAESGPPSAPFSPFSPWRTLGIIAFVTGAGYYGWHYAWPRIHETLQRLQARHPALAVRIHR